MVRGRREYFTQVTLKKGKLSSVCSCHLEKGEIPAAQAKNIDENSIFPGILPVTGLLKPDSFREVKPPVLSLLIKIAIEEKDPDEVIRWYGELKKGGEAAKHYAYYIDENKIANAVHGKYPDIALEIWKNKRKTRFIEILDTLEKDRIIEG